jgi:hypothetical protein
VNHIVVGALMFVFGALVTFSAATAVQYWAITRQPQVDSYNPEVERTLARPAFEYRKRSADCQTPMWPQAGLPAANVNYQQR